MVSRTESVVEALESINPEALDLLLLDVKLPALTRLTMLEALGERRPQIIFVTPAHAEALQRAIAGHGPDYLRKPLPDERFSSPLRRTPLRRTYRRVLQER